MEVQTQYVKNNSIVWTEPDIRVYCEANAHENFQIKLATAKLHDSQHTSGTHQDSKDKELPELSAWSRPECSGPSVLGTTRQREIRCCPLPHRTVVFHTW